MQYLIFTIDDTLYAVDVFHIQEVVSYVPPQQVPCPDPVIAGILSSRGKSVSVVDFRKKFALPEIVYTKLNKIIVLDAISSRYGAQVQFGAIVDSVQEVLALEESSVEDTPELGHSIATRFIKSVAKKDDRFIFILNVDNIFTFEELETIAQAKGE